MILNLKLFPLIVMKFLHFQKKVKNDFTEILLNKFKELKVGDGMDSKNVVVPVIDKKSLTNISEKIKAGINEGSR